VEIQLVEHTGLKVPKRAIVIDENHRPNIKWLVIGCGVSVTIAAVCIILIWKKR
jgi:hypothetical protein